MRIERHRHAPASITTAVLAPRSTVVAMRLTITQLETLAHELRETAAGIDAVVAALVDVGPDTLDYPPLSNTAMLAVVLLDDLEQ